MDIKKLQPLNELLSKDSPEPPSHPLGGLQKDILDLENSSDKGIKPSFIPNDLKKLTVEEEIKKALVLSIHGVEDALHIPFIKDIYSRILAKLISSESAKVPQQLPYNENSSKTQELKKYKDKCKININTILGSQNEAKEVREELKPIFIKKENITNYSMIGKQIAKDARAAFQNAVGDFYTYGSDTPVLKMMENLSILSNSFDVIIKSKNSTEDEKLLADIGLSCQKNMNEVSDKGIYEFSLYLAEILKNAFCAPVGLVFAEMASYIGTPYYYYYADGTTAYHGGSDISQSMRNNIVKQCADALLKTPKTTEEEKTIAKNVISGIDDQTDPRKLNKITRWFLDSIIASNIKKPDNSNEDICNEVMAEAELAKRELTEIIGPGGGSFNGDYKVNIKEGRYKILSDGVLKYGGPNKNEAESFSAGVKKMENFDEGLSNVYGYQTISRELEYEDMASNIDCRKYGELPTYHPYSVIGRDYAISYNCIPTRQITEKTLDGLKGKIDSEAIEALKPLLNKSYSDDRLHQEIKDIFYTPLLAYDYMPRDSAPPKTYKFSDDDMELVVKSAQNSASYEEYRLSAGYVTYIVDVDDNGNKNLYRQTDSGY